MKTAFLFFIFLFFTLLFSYSQSHEVYKGDTINRVDANNKKQGHWIFFDASKTQKTEEGNFKNSRRNAVWKKYYSSGKPKHEITYVNGKPNGYAKFYYENGNISEEGDWRQNKWVGNYKYYFESGNMAYDWNYNAEGNRQGVQKYFHENGNVMIEGDWTDGKESGVLKEYFENGSLKSEKNFADGVMEVSSVKHYEQKVVTKPIVTSTGNKKIAVFSGEGYHKTYNTKGLLDREGVFKGGKFMDGKRHHYDAQGNKTKTEIFRNGKTIEVITN